MSESNSRTKRSEVWMHFTRKTDNKAKCDHCGHELSYRGSTSNLKKHYEAKHSALGELALRKSRKIASVTATSETSTSCATTSDDGRGTQPADPSTSSATSSTQEAAGSSEQKSTTSIAAMKKQSSLSTYVVRPASVVRQKRLNKLLLKMIVRDMQPFSIVDDEGFREFVSALDPSYQLPGRSKLSRELLVDAYYTSSFNGVSGISLLNH